MCETKMRFLALFLLLTPVVYGAAVDADKCAWGESYWCSELNIAKTCGAVQHCITTVWKNQQTKNDTTEVCLFCQSIITDVHKFLGNKKTEHDIAHFLSSACAIIPDVKVASECKTIVEQYTPELIDLVIAEVSPQMVCRLIHLCTGIEDTVLHFPASHLITVPLGKDTNEVDVKDNTQKICTDCKAFFGDIVQMITDNATLSEIEALLDQEVCSLLGSLREECNTLVKQFLPMAIQYIQQLADPNMLCQAMGFCSQTSERAKVLFDFIKSFVSFEIPMEVQSGSAEECLICKTVISELRTMIRDAKFQAKIKDFLTNDVCPRLGTMKDPCILLVDEFLRQALEFLVTILDPNTRCRSFGFCPDDVVSDNVVNIVRHATPQVADSVSNSPECILCEFVMKEIVAIIRDNRTEAKIMEALDKVCTILPSTIRQSCLDFVNTYGRAIISILETEVSPEQVCTFLGLCKSATLDQEITVGVTAGDAETCLICETLVQYAEALIKDNATIQEVEAVVKKICNFMPDTMKTRCQHVIDEYGALIVQYIVNQYDPKEVCTLIKLCDSTNAVHMMNLSPANPRRVGVGKCTYGPAYWCASEQNADECQAVEHCKKYVWKK